ncbi:hypothetical protein GQ44DRAFT_780300 [Phaeosphaeriaceae sp. PMI808]|nr:hypothetical protein GQ44DRAFT_780300 [Phaeosphaeriaceae sp. PMI808]
MAQLYPSPFKLPPPSIFLFELLAGSAVIGCAPPGSLYRAGAVPVLAFCVYGIISTAGRDMRPRWESLLGGTSVAFFLQYIDLALVNQWNFKDQGPSVNTRTQRHAHTEADQKNTFWSRLRFGWNSMWAFRHVNSPYEVKNVPPFSNSDSSSVPAKWSFVGQRVAIMGTCYLLLDLLSLRKPPTGTTNIFDPAFVPMLTRISKVTLPEVKRKALMMVGFAATFYSLIQGTQSACAAVAIASGLSKVENWRPAFGSLSDAYSLKNEILAPATAEASSGPASALAHEVLNLPRSSIPAGLITTFISFTLSAALHAAAGLLSGATGVEFGVFRFFWTQAFGIIIEEGLRTLLRRFRGGKKLGKETSLLLRGIGFVWVAAFLTWSGPTWLYPQASRPSRPGPTGFLPFSIIKVFIK